MVEKRNDDRRKRTSAKAWADSVDKGFEPSAYKVPEGFEILKFEKTGIYMVDFLPYTVGAGNPACDEDMEHPERKFTVHWIASADKRKPYCCRQECFGKKCAVCNWLTKHGRSLDEETKKSTKGKVRHLWICNTAVGKKEPALKLYESSHVNQGKGFAEMMRDAVRYVLNKDPDADPFSLKNGYTAELTVGKSNFDGNDFFLVTRIDFQPRKHPYPSSMIDDMPCLDDLLIDPGYDSIMQLLETGVSDDEDSDSGAAPSPLLRKPPKPAPKQEDEEEDGTDNDEPRRRPAKSVTNGKSKARPTENEEDVDLDESDDEEDEVGLDDDDDIEEDDIDPPPPKKGVHKKR